MSKTSLSKKEKPIMTSEKYKRFFSLTETGQLEILEGLSDRNKERIGEWLDDVEVKEDFDGSPYIVSPFVGLPLYTSKDIAYYTLYKWCASKFEKAKLARLPVPVDMSIYYAYRWKKNPTINPYTNEELRISLNPKGDYDLVYKRVLDGRISLNPKGDYVLVYKRVLDGLINDIMKKKTKKVLTIEECRLIKDALPNDHARVFTDRGKDSIYQVYYDYLFIRYFVKSKTIPFDPAFKDDLNIYLDNAVYDTSQFVYNDEEQYSDFHYTAEYLYIHKFFKNYLLNMEEGSDDDDEDNLSINKLVLKLCIDIYDLLQFMREPKQINSKIITAEIKIINFNIDVLSYCKSLFVKIPFQYVEEYLGNLLNKNNFVFVKEFLVSVLNEGEQEIPDEYKDIYGEIMDYIEEEEAASSDVFDTIIRIYNSIKKLYNNNKKNHIYKKYIKDPYNTNKGVEPQIPIRQQQLPRDLQMYKIRLANLQGNSLNKKELKEFEAANSANKRRLMEIEEEMKGYNERMKKYEFKKDVYDRIYEGKYSPKKRLELLSLNAYKRLKKDEPLLEVLKRKTKSNSSKGSRANRPHNPEKKKAYSSNSYTGNTGSNDKPEGYYTNDTDPYTQEAFSDMHPKKRKYLSDIIYKNGAKEYHYRFDTVNMYNYILKCIDICEKPINFFNRVELTDANIDEVCNKIKHFTKKPTYNSSADIRPLLEGDDCSKYNNGLLFSWDEIIEDRDKDREIIGVINVYPYINLGGIIFKVILQKVLTLPIFNSNIASTFPNHTLMLLEDKLEVGELIGSRFFPYKKNKQMLNLPEFSFNLTDTAETTLERLKEYRQKLEQM